MIQNKKAAIWKTIFCVVQACGVQAANPAEPGTNDTSARRELLVTHPYLHLPVSAKGKDRRMRILVDGKAVRDFSLAFAESGPDFYVACETGSWKGKKIVLELEHPTDAAALERVLEADEVPGAAGIYRETYRPAFHLSPRWGWMGDPNGLVYDGGEYHTFFQYNPYATKWGNMHWGHAVSQDLIHWKELPIALYPPKFRDNPYSGSAVVDTANSAGFKQGSRDPIVLIFESTGRGVCLAYTTDGGRTFKEYEGNPVAQGQGGDPNVFWDEARKRWIMITCKILKTSPEAPPGSPGWLAKATCAFVFSASTDLKKWEYQSQIEDFWECPNFFALPVDGDSNRMKWVLLPNITPSLTAQGKYGGGRYVVGTFDGKEFKAESARLQFNFGNAYGAAQSYNGIPKDDGRRINIGCAFGSRMPGMPFSQMMNFPTELSLRKTPEGIRLCAWPIREIKTLHTNTVIFENAALAPEGTPLSGLDGELLDISAEFSPGPETETLGFSIRGVQVVYQVKSNQLLCADRSAFLKMESGKIKLRLLVDRVSIEIFANEGLVYMPMAVLPKAEEKSVIVFSKGGATQAVSVTAHSLKSIW